MRTFVYSLRSEPLTLEDLHGLPGLPEAATVDHTERGVDLRVLSRLEVALDDGRLVWKRVPSDALPAQLDALRALLAGRPLLEPTLPDTLTRVREAMELVLESESDVDADTFEELVLGLVERLEGFSVWGHGIFDAVGRELVDLRGAADAALSALPPVFVQAPIVENSATEAPAVPTRTAPSADRVVARARALAALSRRGTLEAGGPTAQGAAEIDHLRVFVESAPLRDALFVDEQALMALNPGAWSQRTLVDATWLTEAVATFAWALALYTLPPDDEMVESEPLRVLFCVGRAATADLENAALRAPSALEAERLRQRARHQETLRALANERSTRGLDGLHTRASLAAERVRALDWLCGV